MTGGALAMTVLLTSCIKVDMDIELDEGSASGSMVLAVSQEMMELAAAPSGRISRILEPLYQERQAWDRLIEALEVQVDESDDPDELRDAVGEGEPVDAVLDHLGGPFTQVGLDVLRKGGSLAICGQTAGDRPTIDLPALYLQHHTVAGSTMGTQDDLETVVSLVEDGHLDPPVGGEYELSATAEAFRDLAARRSFGSLVVRP
jgi:NADPH2:quinone reductase